MKNVRLGDGLLTGSDLEIRIDREIDYHGEPMLLPAHRLSAILRAATGDEVHLTSKDATVTVKCGAGSWTLPTEDVAEYPHWEPKDLKAVCRLPADQFFRAARATTYACDTESSRYALGAVLLEIKDGNPTWVATDGRMLACVETETDQAVDDRDVLVPSKVLAIVLGLLKKKKSKIDHAEDQSDERSEVDPSFGSVQIEANDKEVRFTLAGCTVTGRLIEGRFPRWRDVVGEPEGEPSVIERDVLLQAVNAAAIVTSEQSKGVTLDWTSGTLVLAGRSSEYGESLCRCPTIAVGTTASTRLDPQYMAQFLSHLPADEEPHVDVYVKDAASRVLLRCGTYTGVIMPLAADGG
jgi:DNA polymerase-3 subunit beta